MVTSAEAFVTVGAVMVAHEGLDSPSLHRHRPNELIASLDGNFRLLLASGDILETAAIMIPSMAPHAILGYQGRIVRVYVDPEKRRFRHWTHFDWEVGSGDAGAVADLIEAFFESTRSIEAARSLMKQVGEYILSIDNSLI